MQKLEYLKAAGYLNAKDTVFGTLETDQASVPDEDEFPSADIGSNDQIKVDVEEYGQVKKDPGTFYEDNDASGAPDEPFDRFKRITVMKIVDGATGGDNRMVVRVVVYWQGVGGIQKTLIMGMVAL
jgi:hypothetical protein